VAFFRGIDGSEPVGSEPVAGAHEHRRAVRGLLGMGTLACPLCDAPVALAAGPVSPHDPLGCPFCRHTSVVRDFLSLARPTRPARVVVRVVRRRRPVVH
jgi:hypothetical protein